MAVYKCLICGAIYDEEKEGKPLSQLAEELLHTAYASRASSLG